MRAAKRQVEDSNQQLAEQQAALIDSVNAMRTLYAAISIPRRHAGEQIQALLATHPPRRRPYRSRRHSSRFSRDLSGRLDEIRRALSGAASTDDVT